MRATADDTNGWPARSAPAQRSSGISVVVPAYRSPGTLKRLCEELSSHVAPLVGSIEVIIVDDGSGDNTWATIERLAEEHHWIRGFTLLRNYGQHNALLAGIREARMPLILTIDDDLQNPPDQVPRLLAALTDEVDLVYATSSELPHDAARNAASRLAKRTMALALGPDVHPQSGAFRLFRTELVQASAHVNDPFASIDVLLSWATNRVAVVEVTLARREGGTSGYTTQKLIKHALNMITGYSTRPLRWVSAVGVLCAVLGFGLLAYVLATYLLDRSTVPGFSFLAAAITFFSGIQLLSLGVIGEYVGRIHVRTMGRPAYVVRARTPEPTDEHRQMEDRGG